MVWLFYLFAVMRKTQSLGACSYFFSSSCIPVCSQGCERGTCIQPDVCICNFGWTSKNCSVQCQCNGHSNCPNETFSNICTECHNNTQVCWWMLQSYYFCLFVFWGGGEGIWSRFLQILQKHSLLLYLKGCSINFMGKCNFSSMKRSLICVRCSSSLPQSKYACLNLG